MEMRVKADNATAPKIQTVASMSLEAQKKCVQPTRNRKINHRKYSTSADKKQGGFFPMCVKCSHGVFSAENSIRQAIADYGRHTDNQVVLEDIGDEFISKLVKESTRAKKNLRDLFSKSPAWDEGLQALVINGSRTHNPDADVIYNLARQILAPVRNAADYDRYRTIELAIQFFIGNGKEDSRCIEAINSLAPKAYAPNKKPSRIFKALCDALGVTDNSAGSSFQRLFAKFADELSAKKIDFKLFASINPAHFLTMSNPKYDRRGDMLTSCHSLNCTDYTYNCGCVGYARDDVTFIVFTVANPDNPELLNNRKVTRQIFAYKPYNGLLLQSRLYNTRGGTNGEQAESKLYRDLIQREISEIEGMPNLWKTSSYCGNDKIQLVAGYGFGGYPDWTFESFNAKVSVRVDHEKNYEPFTIGSSGLCVCCGKEISEGVYCLDCWANGREVCEHCHERCEDTWAVHDAEGNTVLVCETCLDRHYRRCECCGEYYPLEDMTFLSNGEYACGSCLDENYSRCDECGEYVPNGYLYPALDSEGYEISICDSCRDYHYAECPDCESCVHNDDFVEVKNADGNSVWVCSNCAENYGACDEEGEDA